MQRLEAKNPPKRPLLSAETGNVENRRQESRQKGLFPIDDGFRGSGRLDGGRTRARTWDPMIKSHLLPSGPPHSYPTEIVHLETRKRNLHVDYVHDMFP
jgi:hypothetical protein